MLNHELLINKGFKLNEYPEGKFYELTIQNPTQELSDVLEYDYDPEMQGQVIIQIKEDFLNTVVAIDGEVLDMSVEELEKALIIL